MFTYLKVGFVKICLCFSAEVPLVAADELKRELESLQYREHKRLAIQGRIMAVQYRNLPVEAQTDQGQVSIQPTQHQKCTF